MYQIFGLKRLLQSYAGVSAIVAVIAFIVQTVVPNSPWNMANYVWTPVSIGLGGAAALFWLVGETPLFRYACRHRWSCNILPDLDGEWIGELQSNWPIIAARGAESAATIPLLVRPAKVRIKATLLTVSMFLDTDDKYSNSRTILSGVTRDPVSDECSLTYVYENKTPNPKPSDEASHFGAAILTLKKEADGFVLYGPYWTNRGWHKGLSTAGVAEFRKIKGVLHV